MPKGLVRPQNYNMVIRQVQLSELNQVAELDYEAFSPYGTAEKLETFESRFQAFPDGFIVLDLAGEIVAYGCSEKWLTAREPGLDENPLDAHHAGGTIFCITGMAVRMKYRGKGYGLDILDHLMKIAQDEGCQKIILETTHAQGLYFKRGFHIIHSREDRGVCLDIMELSLEQNG